MNLYKNDLACKGTALFASLSRQVLDPPNIALLLHRYIGSTGPDGLHHLVWEVVDNSVDEALAGHATFIATTLNPDGSCTVVDDGRGIPTDVHPVTGHSALETVLTVLHAGGKFDNESGRGGYKVSGGLHGVGISVVNALSSLVDVVVHRNGKRYAMQFQRGKPTTNLEVTEEGPSIVDEDVEEAVERLKEIKPRRKRSASTADVDDEEDNMEQQKERFDLLRSLLKSRKTGTTVTFLPDIEVFKGENGKPSIDFDPNRLRGRMDEVAFLNAGLVLVLKDKRSEKSKGKSNTEVFYHAGGLAEYLDLLCETKTPLFGHGSGTKGTSTRKRRSKSDEVQEDPLGGLLTDNGGTILCKGTLSPQKGVSPVSVSVALRWSSDVYTESILSFCNNIRTRDGGSHVEGLKLSLTRTINQAAKKAGKIKEGTANVPGEFIREGLTAIVSVAVADPEFEGQTKGRLGNPEVRPAVDSLVSTELTKLFELRPDVLDAIYSKAITAQQAAAAARAARDMVRGKSLLASTVLPGKLADCASNDPAESEIFIVEGDSAAGSAKQGRDRRTQAILPLRGKILNIERVATERIYQNNELQGLISVLGLGIKGSEFDGTALRYGRVIIMTDADVDGAHIRVLLLTFFFRYQRELVERGFVYIAQPPLYKVSMGSGRSKKEAYAFNDAQKEEIIRSWIGPVETTEIDAVIASGKVIIQRFKGLGEMMPEQLWSTTMDPQRRTLLRVTVDDCALADQTLNILMGDAVAPRRNFISSHAERLKLDDLDV